MIYIHTTDSIFFFVRVDGSVHLLVYGTYGVSITDSTHDGRLHVFFVNVLGGIETGMALPSCSLRRKHCFVEAGTHLSSDVTRSQKCNRVLPPRSIEKAKGSG